MSEINNNLNFNKKLIIEGFSSTNIKKANKIFLMYTIPIKQLRIFLKIFNNTLKKKYRSGFGLDKSVFDNNQNKIIISITKLLILLRKETIRICLMVLYYSYQLRRNKPNIIKKFLKKGNKKALFNFKLAAKIKKKAIQKAIRDIKFAKIRAKKIPKIPIKKIKKNRESKEKIYLNYTNLRNGEGKLNGVKLRKSKYESSPIKIAILCFLLYALFNYVYFKL